MNKKKLIKNKNIFRNFFVDYSNFTSFLFICFQHSSYPHLDCNYFRNSLFSRSIHHFYHRNWQQQFVPIKRFYRRTFWKICNFLFYFLIILFLFNLLTFLFILILLLFLIFTLFILFYFIQFILFYYLFYFIFYFLFNFLFYFLIFF